MRVLPKVLLGVAAFAAIAFLHHAWRVDGGGADDDAAPAAVTLVAGGDPVARGRYLATAADCIACHTRPGAAPYSGGVAFRLPMGAVYSSNLTPDRETGIGAWSDEDFLRAVRSGVGRDGRHLYPAFPYTAYAALSRADVLAIRAYLASLEPVRATVPQSTLAFPFSVRGAMRLWNVLYLDRDVFRADGTRDEAWNRGRYLATALGHCGECHTPRNAAFATRRDAALAGAVTLGWKAYALTSSALAGWTPEALDAYLATGHAPGHGAAVGPMKGVIEYSTSQLDASDRAALVRYLLDGVTPAPAALAAAAPVPPGSIGPGLYDGACAACHPLSPGATPAAYADLRGSRTVTDPSGTNVLRLLAEGSGHGAGAGLAMPAFGRGYSDAERAALANFVLATWGGLPPALTPRDARRARLAE